MTGNTPLPLQVLDELGKGIGRQPASVLIRVDIREETEDPIPFSRPCGKGIDVQQIVSGPQPDLAAFFLLGMKAKGTHPASGSNPFEEC